MNRVFGAALIVAMSALGAQAATVSGVDLGALSDDLSAGKAISPGTLQALSGLDVTLLSPEELAALLAVLRELATEGYDVGAVLARAEEQAAFLSATAEDLPIIASPTN